jgi:hypothetical protein
MDEACLLVSVSTEERLFCCAWEMTYKTADFFVKQASLA